MALFSRFFGRDDDSSDEPESMLRIIAELEDLEPDRARFLAAFAYILARAAHADLHVNDSEITEMERALQHVANLPENEARLAVQIAVQQAGAIGGTDDYLVTREYRRMTERPERVRLMRCALAVTGADDAISIDETNEIVSIGEELGFTRPEINSLRLEHRDKLAEFKKLDGES